jgi:hypothetical protein
MRPRLECREFRRRALLWSLVAASCFSLLEPIAHAESPTAPVPVQAQITARILPFERGFAERSKAGALVLIFERSGNADSTAAARQMARALADIGTVGGKPLRSHSLVYTTAAQLATECKNRGAVAAYLTPGLSGDVKAIATSLLGSGVLTVAAMESYVPSGAVLGIEVSAGKPRMSINLPQARAQKLDFPSAVLKLAKVY